MTYQRSLWRGGTDYTGVTLEDIHKHLIVWRYSTKSTLEKLQNFRDEIEKNKKIVHGFNNIVAFLELSISLFSRFQSDFERLINEMPMGVTKVHMEIVNQMYRRSEMHDNSCVNFKRQYIEGSIVNEERIFWLIDNIYSVTADEIVNYSDLSNVASRMKALIGSSLKRKKISKIQICVGKLHQIVTENKMVVIIIIIVSLGASILGIMESLKGR